MAFGPGLSEVGGAAKQIRLLLMGLANRGWEVRGVCRAGTQYKFHVFRSHGLLIVEVPGFNNRILGALLFFALAIPLGLYWGLTTRAFIAVQLMSPATAAAICSKILRRPFLAWPTTSGPLSEVSYVLNTRSARLRRRLLRQASFAVAQNPVAAKELEALLAKNQIVRIPNPVETVSAPSLTGDPNVLYTGRLSEEKDLLRLLEVWRGISARYPDARLTLVGAGGDFRSVEDELKGEVSTDSFLRRSVALPGWVDDVSPYLAAHDLYVFPSRTEGMSNSLLEAVAWRRVIVASDIAPNVEVLGEGYPLLFEVANSISLRCKLELALFDQKARATALAWLDGQWLKLSPATVFQRWEDLIRDAADRPRN